MRTVSENKARAGSCPHCGRPVVPYGCREVPMGFWCLRDGLFEDPRRVIGPTRDPVSRAEQKVIDEYEPLIAEAVQRIDVAMVAHATAERAYQDVLVQCRVKGVSLAGAHSSVVPPGGMDWQPAARPARGAERDRLMILADDALIQVTNAGRALGAARVRFNELSNRRDRSRRAALLGA